VQPLLRRADHLPVLLHRRMPGLLLHQLRSVLLLLLPGSAVLLLRLPMPEPVLPSGTVC